MKTLKDQLQVQLAGCLVAADGGTKRPAKRGDYGWSVAYRQTLKLRKKHDAMKKLIRDLLHIHDWIDHKDKKERALWEKARKLAEMVYK